VPKGDRVTQEPAPDGANALFDSRVLMELPFPVSYLDRDLVYVQCNQAAAATVGLRPEEIVGRAVTDIIGSDSEVPDLLRAVIDTGEDYRGDVVFAAPGTGDMRRYRVAYSADRDSEGRTVGVVTSVVDVTDSERAHEIAAALARVDQAIHASLDFKATAQHALEEGAVPIGAETGAIIAIDGERWVTWNSLGFEPSVEGVTLTNEENPHGVAAVTTMQVVAVDDAYDDARVDGEFMKRFGIRSVIVAPLAIRGRAVAALYYNYNSDVHHFTPAEIDFVSGLASSLSMALDNARLFEDLADAGRRVATVLNSITDAFFALDGEWRFTYVNDEAERMLKHTRTELLGQIIWDVFPQGTDSDYFALYSRAVETNEPVSFESFFPGLALWGEVRIYPSDEGLSVYVRDISKRKAAEEALRASRERASLLAGLLDESSQPFMAGTPDGRLLLFNPAFQRLVGRSGHDLSLAKWPDDLTAPEDLEMERRALAEVARTGVPARYEKEMLRPDGSRVPVEVLRHAEFDEAGGVSYYFAFFTDVSERRAIERLNVALNTIGTAVSATLDESEIVRRLISGTAQALEAEVAGFLRADQGMWVLSATHGLPDTAGGARMLFADVPAAHLAMDSLEPVICDQGACRSDLGTLAADTPRVRSALFFPLVVRGKAMGVAFFAERTTGDGYADVQRDFASRLMATVSLTLENARLYESQRHIADTLQRAVLAPPEDIEGLDVAWLYRPASAAADVGGDFYDVFRIDERRAGIVIGDVSGKGVSAARLTSLMRDGLRAYSYINPDVAWVLGHTNDLVHRSTDAEEFATVFFGVLDLKTNRLDYCGAGHPTIALVRGDCPSVALESRGALLGAFEHMRFAVDGVTIEAGDRLVLYTDGVTEARSDGELFGEENAFRAACELAACELSEVPWRLLERVLEFSGGALRDDCVIVAIERTGTE